MSTVAKSMKKELYDKAGIPSEIINLIDFYLPIRGNMRRNRSRAGSLKPNEDGNENESSNKILKEIQTIDTETDFDDPKQVDYDLLIKGLKILTEDR
jgi:hypothetical protein